MKVLAKSTWYHMFLTSALVVGATACDKKDGDQDDDTQTGTQTGHADTTDGATSTPADTTSDQPVECGTPCDIFGQNCPEGQQCAPYLCDPQSLGWDVDRCVQIGPRTAGQACSDPWTGKADEYCAEGLMCWGGTCTEQCTGTPEDPTCSSETKVCLVGAGGVIASCMKRCDPFNPTSCDVPETCVPAGEESKARDFGCIGNGFIPTPGLRGDNCELLISCADGHYCTLFYGPGAVDAPGCEDKPCCTPFCKLDGGDDQCPGEAEECVPILEDPDPAATNYGWCVVPRNK